ncbi:iron complex outermembrane receptor protein [Methylosinus sp. sav-2]|uniref:TonB-dependent receptor n=1 Tax=Methylosinus sp. sav-2 TaxID=2485168 RepID=UPI000B103120|nr:TonB-dependent siderophore receptor [Methylosinus sp. sav-2]TDX66634.1 iron complex outermembrane receptor protein [Methylosinus sp. sav-2]
MSRNALMRGASAGALSFVVFSSAAAQEALPAIDISGEHRPVAGPSRGKLQPPNGKLQLDVTSQTGSRLGLTPRETPSSVSIVDRATIEARGAQTTQEVIQRMPGVIASDPPGSAGAISLRGFGASSVTQMFNGITVQYDAIAGRPVDSWLYDRIELLGGASSYLYGQGAVGGAVNYVSKVATRGEERNEALLMGGMWFNRRASYGFNKQLDENNWLQFDLSYKGSQGWVEDSNHNSGAGSISWLTDIAPGLSNTVAVEFQSEQRDAYWGTPVPRPLGGTGTIPWGTFGLPVLDLKFDPGVRFKNYNSLKPVFDQQVLWARDITEYKLDEETSFKNTFYLYRADRQYQDVESYRYNATNTLIDRSGSYATRHIQSLIGDRLEATNETVILGFKSKTVAGVDYSLNEQTRNGSLESSSQIVDSVDPYGYRAYKLYQDNPSATSYVGGARSKLYTLALFAENRLSLTEQLHLVTGLRWEKISLERFNYRIPTAPSASNPFGDPAYFGKGYEPITWRAALMYDVTKEANVYVSYSTAADPPSGILLTNNAGGMRNFELTTGWQIEAGTKLDFWEGRGSATLAGYFIERNNVTTSDPANPNNVVNVGKQSSNGIEANVGVQVLDNLSVQGNAAWINPKFESFEEAATIAGTTLRVSRAGNRPTNMARWIANGWITWDFLPEWQATFAARFVGDRFADNANTMRIPAYTTFDAGLSWRIMPNAKLTAMLKNITDAAYVEWATGGSGPLLRLGQPRTVELSLKMTF